MRTLLPMLAVLAGATVAAGMDVPVAAKRLVVRDAARPRLVLHPLVDNIEDLPGPGAVSVPGSIGVCLGVLCL